MFSFTTPKYKLQNIDVPVNVFFQLENGSDKTRSKPITFEYVPDVTNINAAIERKKRKVDQCKDLFVYIDQLMEKQLQRELNVDHTRA